MLFTRSDCVIKHFSVSESYLLYAGDEKMSKNKLMMPTCKIEMNHTFKYIKCVR